MSLSRLSLLLTIALPLAAQFPPPQGPPPTPRRTFTTEVELKHTPVTSQDRTSTCWCFATNSFFEAELMRLGKGTVGLSEVFVVRNTYPRRGWHYYRNQGAVVWSPGGQAHDWVDTVKTSGIVPREAYTGLLGDAKAHNHSELHDSLKAYMDVVAKAKQPTNRWPEVMNGMLDGYLGKAPTTFTYQGKSYTPQTFRDSLGLNFDDYVEIGSFTHHPFYLPFRLEVQDNWSQNAKYYNVPLDELEQIMLNALRSGYTFAWDGDMSEKGFDQKNLGYAYMPKADDQKHEEGKAEEELEATPELRQAAFDDFRTTDDHLMHIVGLSKDQFGNQFYITKNSWGPKNGPQKGYVHMSRQFVRMKTLAILVHKKAIPAAIAAKLEIK